MPYSASSTLNRLENLSRWVVASQTNQVTIGRVGLDAFRFCMVAQKIMEPELHHEATQPFGWRRRDARLYVRKYFALGDGLFLASRCLRGLKRGEPLLENSTSFSSASFSSMSFPAFSGTPSRLGRCRGPK